MKVVCVNVIVIRSWSTSLKLFLTQDLGENNSKVQLVSDLHRLDVKVQYGVDQLLATVEIRGDLL